LYHERMSNKWTRAMRLPWLSVPDDPPPPFPLELYANRESIY